jgi:hypothetical protein
MAYSVAFAVPVAAGASASIAFHRHAEIIARYPGYANITLVSLSATISYDIAANNPSTVEAAVLLDSSVANLINMRRSNCYVHRYASTNEPGSVTIALDLNSTPVGTELMATPTGARPPQLVISNQGTAAMIAINMTVALGAVAPVV